MMANWLLPFTLDATEGRLEIMSLTPLANPYRQQGARIGPTEGKLNVSQYITFISSLEAKVYSKTGWGGHG